MNSFVLPDAWTRLRHPDRDHQAAPPTLSKKALPIRAVLADRSAEVQKIIEGSGADVIAAVADPAAPLGRALEGLAADLVLGYRGRAPHEGLIDLWVADHPLPFVASILMEALQIDATDGIAGPALGVGVTEVQWYSWRDSIARFRRFVAASTAAEYADVVDTLAAYRAAGDSEIRLVTSYLAPTRTDWSSADLANLTPTPHNSALALAVMATPAEFTAILAPLPPYLVDLYWDWVVTGLGRVGGGAASALAELAQHEYTSADLRGKIALALAAMETDAAMELLLHRRDQKQFLTAFMEASTRRPACALRLLAGHAVTDTDAGRLLRIHIRAHRGLAEASLDSMTPEAAHYVRRVLDEPVLPDATPSDLPSTLVAPPWEGTPQRVAPTVLTLTPIDRVELAWLPGEREAWATKRPAYQSTPEQSWEEIAAWIPHHANGARSWEQTQFLTQAPPELVRPVLPHMMWMATSWSIAESLEVGLARLGTDLLPIVFAAATSNPASNGHLLLPVTGTQAAQLMAQWSTRKSTRSLAARWLDRHPHAAATGLIPSAVGSAGADRRAARAALRRVASAAGREVVEEAALEYGSEPHAAILALLDEDPLVASLPRTIPALPTWLAVTALPQLDMADRAAAVPTDAAANLVTMLAISTLEAPYPGVDTVLPLLDSSSAAEWGWELFELWAANGFPSKQGWVLDAQAIVGDDETVRRLSPLIQRWPGESAHKRAVQGLDVLAAIGSDVALMHLHRISQRVKFKALKARANELVDEIAAGLGLSSVELADRLVPDFGLDAASELELDYGPRTFVVGFDEALRPFVTENGVRRKDLPKPGARDGAEVAKAAHARYRALKKDVRTVSGDLIARVEQAMVSQRSWVPEIFSQVFVDHPLSVHVARRLVWSATDSTGEVTYFRVAEDRGLVDVDDEPLDLAAGSEIRVAHPVLMELDMTAKWSELFADYELSQPFPQLARPVYHLAAEVRAGAEIELTRGVTVPTTKLLGMEKRGWRRSSPMDAGIQSSIYRELPGDEYLVIDLDPGIAIGMGAVDGFDEQVLGATYATARIPDWGGGTPTSLRDIDVVTASEVLLELTGLIS